MRQIALSFAVLMLLMAAPAAAHHPDADPNHRDTISEVNFDFAAAVENGEPTVAGAYGDSGLTYLPLTWCGNRRTTDDTTNNVHPATLPQIKFVYAYASDQTDRTTEWADLMQANASLISRFYAQQSSSQRAPRLDMGNNCGADYVDIATVALPSPRSAYVDSFSAVENAVYAALPKVSGQPRNYVILADKLTSGGVYGLGAMYPTGDSKGTGNIHNAGHLNSIIFISQNTTLPTGAAKNDGYWPEGFLHEMSHNFGAVSNNAPNTSGAGHCVDGRDVMCYADGGPNPYSSSVCGSITTFTSGFAQILDCGRNDYFSPAPTAGSWLDTHHNTFDSVFNADCPTLGNQCGGSTNTPSVTGGPSVSGTARQTKTLTAGTGTWSNSTSTSYTWEEEVNGSWQPYAHDSLSLTLGSANVGRRYRLKVTAVGTETVVARSAATAAVTAPLTPTLTAYPTVSGTARSGQVVTTTNGSWNNASTYAYQWQRWTGSSWSNIAGATASSYTLGESDINTYVRPAVTATSEDGLSATAANYYVGPVVAGPINTALPTISGTAQVGQSLSSTTGTWSQTVNSYSRQWQREVDSAWTNISGATGTDYTVTSGDLGYRLRVAVTATGPNGGTTANSDPTAAVIAAGPAPSIVDPPVVTGNSQQGQTLTVGSDTWNDMSSTSVAWQRKPSGGSWTTIANATARTYLLVEADVASEIRAVVTATNANGSTAVESAARGPVTTAKPVPMESPSVTGTAKRTKTLQTDNGVWANNPSSYAYAWQRLVDSEWQTIASATASSYVPVSDDVGKRLRVRVTATNAYGTADTVSTATSTVVDLAPPVNSVAPAVTGTAQQGQTMTVASDEWTGMTSTSVVWQRRASGGGWATIAGGVARTYVLTADDVDHDVRAVVTATNDDGSTVKESAARGPVVTNVPPANSVLPAISGVARTGEVLTATSGTWVRATSYSFQWQRLSGEWGDIQGAVEATYSPVSADAGKPVRVVVTATGPGGSTPSSSAQTAAIADPPVLQSVPTISGSAKRTKTLTTTSGTWTNATDHAYAWQRQEDGEWTTISGATAATYVPVAGDVGRALRVRVTASNATGSADPAFSEATPAVIDLEPPVNLTAPVVTGVLYDGETLTAADDDWTGETSVSVQWQRKVGDADWTDIATATTRTYALGGDDLDARVRVVLTAANADGTTSKASAPRGPVDGDPASVTPPSIAGTPKVGVQLTASDGTWKRASSYTYAWQRLQNGDWSAIEGATSSAYTPVAADAGLPLRVRVTGVGSRASSTASSAQTAAVAAPAPPADGPAAVQTVTPPTAPFDVVKVLLKTGKKSSGKLTFRIVTTATTMTAAIGAKGLKVKNGTYTLKVCVGRKCASKKVKVTRGKLTVKALRLPATNGRLTVSLKPKRGKAPAGRLALT